MSIRFRLNALMIALLTLALVSFIGAMYIEAGPRIHAENESISRLSKEFVETAGESLQGTTNPGARLAVLLDGLKNLRHVHIYFANDPKAAAEAEADAEQATSWLPRLAEPTAVVQVPVFVNGQSFGELVIAEVDRLRVGLSRQEVAVFAGFSDRRIFQKWKSGEVQTPGPVAA